MGTAIDTKYASRRALRFTSIDDLLAEVARIEAADGSGALQRSGNWTAGQNFGHLASWINYAYEGYPFQSPPWFVRFMLRMMKGRYLRKGMPQGVRIPGAAEGTWGTEPLTTAEGAQRLRAALQRLRSEPARHPSPAFGPMSHEDRIALNLRHAELHLGFLRYS